MHLEGYSKLTLKIKGGGHSDTIIMSNFFVDNASMEIK